MYVLQFLTVLDRIHNGTISRVMLKQTSGVIYAPLKSKTHSPTSFRGEFNRAKTPGISLHFLLIIVLWFPFLLLIIFFVFHLHLKYFLLDFLHFLFFLSLFPSPLYSVSNIVTYLKVRDLYTGFECDDWTYCTLHIPLGTTGNYSAIDISTLYKSLLHPLVSSVFTSH
jgi:hypothetical protein